MITQVYVEVTDFIIPRVIITVKTARSADLNRSRCRQFMNDWNASDAQ